MKYKVGDKVRIKKRVGESDDYPFCFIDCMADLAGQVYTITKIQESEYPHPLMKEDPHLYALDEPNDCSWHSSMFEPVDKDPSVDIKLGSGAKIHLDLSEDSVQIIL